MCREWNVKMKEEIQKFEQEKQRLTREVLEGTLNPAVVDQMKLPVLTLAPERISKNWAWRFRKAFGWVKRSTNTAGIYLPFEHPKMQAARHEFEEDLQRGIDRRLILNIDQLWRAAYNGCKHTLRKDRVGRVVGRYVHTHSLDSDQRHSFGQVDCGYIIIPSSY